MGDAYLCGGWCVPCVDYLCDMVYFGVDVGALFCLVAFGVFYVFNGLLNQID